MVAVIESKKSKYVKLIAGLQQARVQFEQVWLDEDAYILPGKCMINPTDNGKMGQRLDDFIIDETATLAARTLSSGFVAGMTSPARPWVRITVEDQTIAEQCRWWCDEVSDLILGALGKSNIYDSFAQVYEDEGVFGQSPMFIEEDTETVIHTWVFQVGSYWIAQDTKGKVNVFVRKYQMTVRQIVDDFGRHGDPAAEIDWSNISSSVRQMWESGSGTENLIDVTHIICPNSGYDKSQMSAKYKTYHSCYFETGSGGGEAERDEVFLRESGYDYFPVLCPRWTVTGQVAYATNCPGKTALGSIKSLQQMHKEKARAIQVMTNPPLNAPGSMRHKVVTSIPGTVNWIDPTQGNQKVEPVYQVTPPIQEMREEINETRGMIKETFFENLFLRIINDDRNQPATAAEIHAIEQEKLLAVGPVLERNNRDLLAPTVEITFMMLARQGRIPEPPPILRGQPLKIEYLSFMAQAQKAAGLGSMDRLLNVVGRVAALNPAASDKFDFDQYLDEYADRSGAPARLIIPDDQVAMVRQARAKAEQAKQMAAAIPPMAGAARDLSQAPLDTDSALSALLERSKAGQLVNTGA